MISARSLIGDAGLGELRIVVLREGRRGGEVEAGGVDPLIQSALSTVASALDRLDGLGRLRAVVVLDQLDLALPFLELEAAALVDLVGPEPEGREMGDRGAGRQRAGFGADHANFDRRQVRPGGAIANRSGQCRRSGIFQEFASSHV